MSRFEDKDVPVDWVDPVGVVISRLCDQTQRQEACEGQCHECIFSMDNENIPIFKAWLQKEMME